MKDEDRKNSSQQLKSDKKRCEKRARDPDKDKLCV